MSLLFSLMCACIRAMPRCLCERERVYSYFLFLLPFKDNDYSVNFFKMHTHFFIATTFTSVHSTARLFTCSICLAGWRMRVSVSKERELSIHISYTINNNDDQQTNLAHIVLGGGEGDGGAVIQISCLPIYPMLCCYCSIVIQTDILNVEKISTERQVKKRDKT